MLANHSQRFAEALEVDDFALPQETDRRDDIGVIHQLENVVVGRARLLLRRHVFGQIGDRVTLGSDCQGAEGRSPRRLRVNSRGEIHKVRVKALRFDLFRGQIARQLIHDRADHFKVRQFLCAQRSIGNVPMYQIRGQAGGLWL